MAAKDSGLELFMSYFNEGKYVRPPYIIWCSSLGPKVVKRSLEEQLTDPALISKNVNNCANLFGADGLVITFSEQFPVEACEISLDPFSVSLDCNNEKYAAIMEGTNRVKIVLGGKVALIGAVPGPAFLAKQIMEILGEGAGGISSESVLNQANQVVSMIITRFMEIGLPFVTLVESEKAISFLKDSLFESYKGGLETITNVVSYHSGFLLLTINDFPLEDVQINKLKEINDISGYILHHESGQQVRQLPGKICITVPSSLFDVEIENCRLVQSAFLTEISGSFESPFLSTHQELPHTTSFPALRTFGSLIKELNKQ